MPLVISDHLIPSIPQKFNLLSPAPSACSLDGLPQTDLPNILQSVPALGDLFLCGDLRQRAGLGQHRHDVLVIIFNTGRSLPGGCCVGFPQLHLSNLDAL
jgi:hypothetical protein